MRMRLSDHSLVASGPRIMIGLRVCSAPSKTSPRVSVALRNLPKSTENPAGCARRVAFSVELMLLRPGRRDGQRYGREPVPTGRSATQRRDARGFFALPPCAVARQDNAERRRSRREAETCTHLRWRQESRLVGDVREISAVFVGAHTPILLGLSSDLFSGIVRYRYGYTYSRG